MLIWAMRRSSFRLRWDGPKRVNELWCSLDHVNGGEKLVRKNPENLCLAFLKKKKSKIQLEKILRMNLNYKQNKTEKQTWTPKIEKNFSRWMVKQLDVYDHQVRRYSNFLLFIVWNSSTNFSFWPTDLFWALCPPYECCVPIGPRGIRMRPCHWPEREKSGARG